MYMWILLMISRSAYSTASLASLHAIRVEMRIPRHTRQAVSREKSTKCICSFFSSSAATTAGIQRRGQTRGKQIYKSFFFPIIAPQTNLLVLVLGTSL